MIRKYPIISFFLLANIISWLIWLPLFFVSWSFDGKPYLTTLHFFGAIGPAIAAFITIHSLKGWRGVKKLLSSLFIWKLPIHYYLIALLGPLLLLLIAVIIHNFNAEPKLVFQQVFLSKTFPGSSATSVFFISLLCFGFGEEAGWRGLALDQLQKKFSVFSATVLLTIGWAIWHLPLFIYNPAYIHLDAFQMLGWFLSLLTGAMILSWLFNSTGGSVLICALFHSAVSMGFTSKLSNSLTTTLFAFLLGLWGLGVAIFFLSKGGGWKVHSPTH